MPPMSILKRIAQRVAPALVAERARQYEHRYRAEIGLTELAQRLPPVVQAGPFAGMKYPDRFEEVGTPVAKLLGTYEIEIAEIISRCAGPFYDIGSADGYFAVGMAMRDHRVIAWDLSRNAREFSTAMAALNGVTIDQRREFDVSAVDVSLGGLVLCDIEGAENDVLTSETVALLPTVVVEVHEDEFPGTSDRLRAAFAPTHDVERIDQQPRSTPKSIAEWTEPEQSLALAEFRQPAMHWLRCARRA